MIVTILFRIPYHNSASICMISTMWRPVMPDVGILISQLTFTYAIAWCEVMPQQWLELK